MHCMFQDGKLSAVCPQILEPDLSFASNPQFWRRSTYLSIIMMILRYVVHSVPVKYLPSRLFTLPISHPFLPLVHYTITSF